MFKFKPSRSEAEESASLVSDLDALIQKPVKVRLLGKDRLLKPVTTVGFFQVFDELDKVAKMKDKPGLSTSKIIQAYYDIFKCVTDDISLQDVEKMSHTQCASLIALIMDHIQGKTHGEHEKKKIVPPSESTRP